MAVYKVPQDVEADDKLIGPFTFRQFIYLIVVSLSIMLAWALAQVFLPLAFIPVPVIIIFGALALPLRKDQPMETYLAAIVSFYLKPRKRLWESDGIDSLIEITAPKTIETQLTKDLSQTEAQRRLSYLAEIVDSRGWAVRGQGVQAPNSAMLSDIYFAAQQVPDILDDNNAVSQSFDQKLDQNDVRKHQQMVSLASGNSNPFSQAKSSYDYFNNSSTETNNTPEPDNQQELEFNPYPTDIQQSVLQPSNPSERLESEDKPKPNTSEKAVPTGIINLASNPDLSIETIAREANRIQKEQDSEEVVISLR
jgi:hypothetical protein